MAFSRVKLSSLGGASTCAFTGGNTLGNFIVVCWLTNGVIATTCTDTQGNTYTLLNTNVAATNKLAIFMAPVTVGGSGTNTVTVSGGGTGFGTQAIEYSGKLAASSLEPNASKPTTGSSGTIINYSISPGVSGELMFGCMNSSGGGASWTLSGTAGFNMQFNSGNFMASFDNLNCGAGTQTPNASISSGAVLTGLMIGLKPATGNPNSLMLMGSGT